MRVAWRCDARSETKLGYFNFLKNELHFLKEINSFFEEMHFLS